MKPAFEVINPVAYPHWDEIVRSHPACSIFHTAAWARVLHESYGYQPRYFAATAGKELRALLPVMEIKSVFTGRRGVCLPFSDYGDPILAPDMNVEEALRIVQPLAQKSAWSFFELRDAGGLHCAAEPAARFYGHVLQLQPEEKKLFAGLRNSTRRNVLKAQQEGISAGRHYSLEAVREFYRLHGMTRKLHGAPPQPFHFFKKIHEHIISRKMGVVILAAHQKKNIAAAVYFHFGEKALYKYGASDRAYQHLRANNLVMWEAIKWHAQNGCKRFCFGRTEMDNDGLRQFKNGWGAQERVIKYYRYDFGRNAFVQNADAAGGRMNKLFGAMPIPCLRAIGAIAYKHMG